MRVVEVVVGAVPGLMDHVQRHPGCRVVGVDPALRGLTAEGRQVIVGPPGPDFVGLLELADNNPIVCATDIVVPEPASTLALIALEPAIRGRMTQGPIAVETHVPSSEDLEPVLRWAGWCGETNTTFHEDAHPAFLSLEASFPVRDDASLGEVIEAYDEAFGSSFFVRRWTSCEVTQSYVGSRIEAGFVLSTMPTADPVVKVVAVSSTDGKSGAAQILHAFNVMFGFEETAGLA